MSVSEMTYINGPIRFCGQSHYRVHKKEKIALLEGVIAILKAFYNDNSYQRDKATVKKDLFNLFQNERYFTNVKNHLKTPEEIKQFIVTLLTWGDDNRLSLLKV